MKDSDISDPDSFMFGGSKKGSSVVI